MSPSNFDFLRQREPDLWQLGTQAERYFHPDPNTCLLKLRQFGEQLAQDVAGRMDLHPQPGESQFELIGRLQRAQLVPYEVSDLLHKVRMVGNEANHAGSGDHRSALATLKLCWQLALWLHRSFTSPGYKSGPFSPPQAGSDGLEAKASITTLPQVNAAQQPDAAVQRELARLRDQARSHRESASAAQSQLQDLQRQQADTQAQQRASQQTQAALNQALRTAQDEQAALQTALDRAQAEADAWEAQAQAASQRAPADAHTAWRLAMDEASNALSLDEFEARELIDAQLRAAGWQVDSAQRSHALGARPKAGCRQAIANWPLTPQAAPDDALAWADYVLFDGERAVALVEAQPARVDLPSCLPLAEFKAQQLRSVLLAAGLPVTLGMVYAANGRPWAPSLPSKSGIWCRDPRDAQGLPHDLAAFHQPGALARLLAQPAHNPLADLQSPAWRALLQAHQRRAVAAAEARLAQGQRRMLLCLAPGTGKHRCAAALLVHLLAAGRVQHVLWLDHDSTPLPDAPTWFDQAQTLCQALSLPPSTAALLPDGGWRVMLSSMGRMADALALQKADEHWGVGQFDLVLALDNLPPGLHTPADPTAQPRGHASDALQAQLADANTVLGRFDCPVIGLAAAPTVHLQYLFGAPAFQYGVADAVVDGVRLDHAPPEVLHTQLSVAGVWLPAGKVVDWLDLATEQVAPHAPSQALSFELEDFNRRVIVPGHTQAVCDVLARHIEPDPARKTVVCCVDAEHADRVALALQRALLREHPTLPESAVARLDAELPGANARWQAFCDHSLPLVAVSAHSLPLWPAAAAVHTLVLLRREDSVLWLDQWCSRAARPAPAGSPPTPSFRIIDAASQYEPGMQWNDAGGHAYPASKNDAPAPLQTQPPTAPNPRGKRRKGKAATARAAVADAGINSSVVLPAPRLTAWVAELMRVDDDAARAQLAHGIGLGIAAGQAHALPLTRALVRQVCGEPLSRLPALMQALPPADLPGWWRQRPGLAELLDALAPQANSVQRLPICPERDLPLSLQPSWGDAAVWQPDGQARWLPVQNAEQLLTQAKDWAQALWQRAQQLPSAAAPDARAASDVKATADGQSSNPSVLNSSLAHDSRASDTSPAPTAPQRSWAEQLASPGTLAALRDWVQRPHAISPAAARQLAVAMHEAGYGEARLAAAWATHQGAGQTMWPRHGGWVRHWLCQQAVLDHRTRCNNALQALIARHPTWSVAQRDATQGLRDAALRSMAPTAELWATPRTLETPDQARQRLGTLFGGQLDEVVLAYRQALWA